MTAIPLPVETKEFAVKQSSLIGILELTCQQLDLTPTQYERAKDSYEAVGKWIATSSDPRLRSAYIYPQGSIATETTNRPLHGDEFDVDSVDHVIAATTLLNPRDLKNLVGDRLKENSYYASILVEKPRCWRLNYKGEFHIDLTPSIPNANCVNGGELIPDKELRCWKPSNPRGFRSLFDQRNALVPSIRLQKAASLEIRAAIESLPVPSSFKGFLRRIVQLEKRHRDVFFDDSPEIRPISVILTTLASQSYGYCATKFEYDTEFAFLLDVVERMTTFIQISDSMGRKTYAVWNETTAGENFAEKWNRDSRLPLAFYKWHAAFLRDLRLLQATSGIDQITKAVGRAFGEKAGDGVRNHWSSVISDARTNRLLTVSGTSGLALRPVQGNVPVKTNTFYGR